MLSDFYIPFDVDYELQKFEDFTNTAVNSRISCVDSDKNLSTSSDTEESTFFIGTRDLCLSHKKKKKSKSNFLQIITNFIIMFKKKFINNILCRRTRKPYIRNYSDDIRRTLSKSIISYWCWVKLFSIFEGSK